MKALELETPQLLPLQYAIKNHPQRILKGSCEKRLLANGCRLNDQITIIPSIGKKKIHVLKRPGIEFTSYPDFDGDRDRNGDDDHNHPSPFMTSIYLPGLNNEPFHFQLILCQVGNGQNQELSWRYLLKSLNSLPFSINGSLSYESYVERGDKITFAYNHLLFQKIAEALPSEYSWSPEIDQLLHNHRFMQSNFSVLIEGETGTGKSQLAKIIHEKSQKTGSFVHLNLSSLTPSLIESELFGHAKGAFTGAIIDRKGALLEANHGTLFLDEIDSLSREMQTKLLLFLDNQEFRPVGSNQNIRCHLRLIFASGKKCFDLVRTGEMRADFYYRISAGAMISLSPLRDRPHDIENLCNHISAQEDFQVSKKLVAYYKTLPWPGNLRQLISHLKKKFMMGNGRRIDFDQDDEELATHHLNHINPVNHLNLIPWKEERDEGLLTLEEMKYRYIQKVYMHFEGSLTHCSKVLKISTNTVKAILKI